MTDKNRKDSFHRAVLQHHYCKHRAGVSTLKACYNLSWHQIELVEVMNARGVMNARRRTCISLWQTDKKSGWCVYSFWRKVERVIPQYCHPDRKDTLFSVLALLELSSALSDPRLNRLYWWILAACVNHSCERLAVSSDTFIWFRRLVSNVNVKITCYMSFTCSPTLSNTNAALCLLTALLSTKVSQVSHVCKAGANDCLRPAECRVNYALRVCAHVHAILRANLQSLGQLSFLVFWRKVE